MFGQTWAGISVSNWLLTKAIFALVFQNHFVCLFDHKCTVTIEFERLVGQTSPDRVCTDCKSWIKSSHLAFENQ